MMKMPLLKLLVSIVLFGMITFNTANARTCPATGCTYQALGCSYSGTRLDCYNDGITGPVNITNIPNTTTELDLQSNQITSIAPDQFKGLTELTRLYLG